MTNLMTPEIMEVYDQLMRWMASKEENGLITQFTCKCGSTQNYGNLGDKDDQALMVFLNQHSQCYAEELGWNKPDVGKRQTVEEQKIPHNQTHPYDPTCIICYSEQKEAEKLQAAQTEQEEANNRWMEKLLSKPGIERDSTTGLRVSFNARQLNEALSKIIGVKIEPAYQAPHASLLIQYFEKQGIGYKQELVLETALKTHVWNCAVFVTATGDLMTMRSCIFGNISPQKMIAETLYLVSQMMEVNKELSK